MASQVDRAIDALRAARADLADEDAVALYVRALGRKHARIVASAARWIGEGPPATAAAFEDALIDALDAWLEDATRSDPGCVAKAALVRALVARESGRLQGVTPGRLRGLLRRGARHVQWEKVYGGVADVAGDLRIAAAAGLVTVGDPETLTVLADLLADPLAPVRRAAALDLRACGGTEGRLLLRLRARLGDEEADVFGETLRCLLALDPSAVDVAATYLLHADAVDEATFAEAALALGDVGSPEALATLVAAWDAHIDPERRGVLVTAIGQIRSEAAEAFLLEVVRDAAVEVAADAARLLAAAMVTSERRARLEEAASARSEAHVREAAGLDGP